jgi:hypothetical protein
MTGSLRFAQGVPSLAYSQRSAAQGQDYNILRPTGVDPATLPKVRPQPVPHCASLPEALVITLTLSIPATLPKPRREYLSGGAGQRVQHPVVYEAPQQRARWLTAQFHGAF